MLTSASTTLSRFNLPLHQPWALALAACLFSFSSQYLGICDLQTLCLHVMKLHLHFCSNQHGYALTPKIKDFLLPLHHTRSLWKLSPRSPMVQPFLIRHSLTKVSSGVSGHQYGHYQTPSLSQVCGNTVTVVTTTYTFHREKRTKPNRGQQPATI